MVALYDLNSHGKLFVEDTERFELDQSSIHIAEDVLELMAHNELIKFFIVHVASLFVLLFLIGFQNRSLKRSISVNITKSQRLERWCTKKSLFFMH